MQLSFKAKYRVQASYMCLVSSEGKTMFFFATVGFVLKMGFLVIVFDVNSQTFYAIFSTVPVCICSDTEGWPQSHMFVMG